MNMMDDFCKTIIEYNLCKKIMKNQTNIINELNIILTKKITITIQKTYKIKIKKTFHASVNTNYGTYNNFLIK